MGMFKPFSRKSMKMSESEFDKVIEKDRPTSSLADIVKDIYDEKKFAEYAGGTLTFPVEREGEKYNFVFLNINKCPFEDEKFWTSMCYIKYKSPAHSFWDDAIDCIILYAERFNQQIEVAKLLLLQGVDSGFSQSN